MLNVRKQEPLENSTGIENNVEVKDEGELREAVSAEVAIPQVVQPQEEDAVPTQKIKKVSKSRHYCIIVGIAIAWRLTID